MRATRLESTDPRAPRVMIRRIHINGYRSVQDLGVTLGPVNVFVGPNGCGTSNLYRGLFLLAEAAHGRLARALASEGGIQSALWAGSRRRQRSAEIVIAAALDELQYEIALGVSALGAAGRAQTVFGFDPQVRRESLRMRGEHGRDVTFLERALASATVVDGDGRRFDYPLALTPSESAVSQLREPHRYPELSALREALRRWRFYHHFRTDSASPLRQPRIGVRTPILDHAGEDLAAALQTILECHGPGPLDEAFDAAFPGGAIRVDVDEDRALFEVQVRWSGVGRWLRACELSDGTLRYLCLLAVLMSPEPASLLALNEPETSLHPDLLAPLADRIVAASRESQVWVTTHSRPLAEAIAAGAGVPTVELEQVDGETRIVGRGRYE